MSFLEWFGESYNPGPSGSLDFRTGKRPDRPRGEVLLRFLASVALLAAFVFFCAQGGGDRFDIKIFGFSLLLLTVYLVVAYVSRPEPDTSNMGWAGGLIDDPFRYSDDWNRFLFFLRIAFLPGRFMAESIVDFFVMLRQA